jgi:hypothetical protein
MTEYGVDYSRSKPKLSDLSAAGKTFVCRYLAPLPNTKVISVSELHTLQDHGFGVVFNWEAAAGDMLSGYAKGKTHAKLALAQITALGVPRDIPVYFSCDRDITTSAQMEVVTDYLKGCAEILGKQRVGVYGEYAVIEALVPKYAQWGWQTYAWSNGKLSGKAHLYQYHNGAKIGGADVDLDRSLKAEFGAWKIERVRHMASLNGLALPELLYGDADNKVPGYEHIHRVQLMLNFQGAKLTVDGWYWAKTADALKDLFGGDGKKVTLPMWTKLYGLTKAVS